MNSMKNETYSTVCIQKAGYDDMDIDSLIHPLGGMTNYIKKGEKVLLKTNLLNATPPDKSVITHPNFIAAVAESVKKAGGIPYIGDSPSGNFSKRRLKKVYQKSGLISLSKEKGIDLNYDIKSKKISIPHGKKLKNTRICDFVINADKIIALPKIKTHTLMMLSLAEKIMFGAVPGLIKASYHAKYNKNSDFADMLLDVLSITNPTLFIMDGIIGMQGEGPMSGTSIELGTILASDNPVALDIAVCEMLNIQPLGIPTLKQAKIRKMWPKNITYPILQPKDVSNSNFELPSTANYLLTGKKKPAKYPNISSDCVACGECVRICPKKAIGMENNKVTVDKEKCIRCYCCHEVCTYDAIFLK